MEKLIETLEIALLRMRGGSTLLSSLKGFHIHQIPCSREIKTLWNHTTEEINNGKINALPALTALLDFVQTKSDIKAQLDEKIRMPKAQSLICFFLGLIGCLLAPLFLPPILRPSLIHTLVALGWAVLGYFLSCKLIERTERSLWFCDWFFFLKNIETHLKTGNTLRASLDKCLTQELSHKSVFPKSFRKCLILFLHRINNLEEEKFEPHQFPLKIEHESLISTHLIFFRDSLLTASPLIPNLEYAIKQMGHKIPYIIKQKADRLSFLLFLPLFLFQLPAVLSLWVWPFLKHLNQALKSM